MSYPEKLAGQRIIVTGGAGFIGSNVVRRLLTEGARVVVLDDFYTGDKNNLPTGEPNLEVVRGSVTDFELVRGVVEGASLVFHLAARNIIVSTRNPREDYEVNIGGTLNVLLAARETSVPRVVYSSSTSVYGNPRYLPINEDDATNMLSPYAVSKFAGENYCKAFYESYGMSSAVVRYSNVYGVAQRPDNPYCGVVSKFFESAMNGEPPRIHGDGEQTRDFTYIDDVVEATLLAGISPKADGQVYNVGTGREVVVAGRHEGPQPRSQAMAQRALRIARGGRRSVAPRHGPPATRRRGSILEARPGAPHGDGRGRRPRGGSGEGAGNGHARVGRSRRGPVSFQDDPPAPARSALERVVEQGGNGRDPRRDESSLREARDPVEGPHRNATRR